MNEAHEVGLAIVDHALSPVQQRNLEKAWGCKALDRTGLILEIFGERARTREGRLQVELAHLTYQKSRLVRTWTALGAPQRGGFGFMEALRGADRNRPAPNRRAHRGDPQGSVKTRGLHRAGRSQVVALVGYTNAGKSTLFNRVTGAEVSAKDQVFETLASRPCASCACRAVRAHPVRHGWLHLRSANPAGGALPGLTPSRWWSPTWCCTCATSATPRPTPRVTTWSWS